MIQETLQFNGKRETIQQKMLGNLVNWREKGGSLCHFINKNICNVNEYVLSFKERAI